MIGLCISGGGAKIGFGVGVLDIMEKKGIKPELAYGISSGSLCTASLCFGGPNFRSSIDYLKTMLLNIKKKEDVLDPQIFKAFVTQIFGIGKSDGLYGMKTMRKKLDELPEENPVMKGVVGYVDLKKGNIKYISSDTVNKEEFLNAVQASCTIPLAMQTQREESEVRVDGGVRDVLPLNQLIEDSPNMDEIHVVSLNPFAPREEDIKEKILPVTLRSIDLLINEVLRSDLKIAKLYNQLIEEGQSKLITDKRLIKFYEYVPTRFICGSIDFNKENIQKGIDHGIEIANEVLKNYP